MAVKEEGAISKRLKIRRPSRGAFLLWDDPFWGLKIFIFFNKDEYERFRNDEELGRIRERLAGLSERVCSKLVIRKTSDGFRYVVFNQEPLPDDQRYLDSFIEGVRDICHIGRMERIGRMKRSG